MKPIAMASLLSLLALTGCNSTNTRGPGAEEITITTPPSLILTRGASQEQQFAVNRLGFSDPVVLSISDLPSGVTATPAKATVEGGTVMVTFSASPDAPVTANHMAKATGMKGPNQLEVAHRFAISVK